MKRRTVEIVISSEALSAFDENYKKAENLFQNCESFTDDTGKPIPPLFIIQQAVAQTLRSLLVTMSGNTIRVNSISLMLWRCKGYANRLYEIFITSNKEEEHLLHLMDNVYERLRYRNEEILMPEEELQKLKKIARLIMNTARESIDREVENRLL